RNRAHSAALAGDVQIGQIVDIEHGIFQAPLHVRVHAALPGVRPFFRQLPNTTGLVGTHGDRNRRKERWATGFQVEVGAGIERNVANDLGFQAVNGKSPEINVGWICLQVDRLIIRRGHLVRRGSHDQALNRFDAPPLAPEFGGQPVEQLRMRWQRAHLAEVARSGHYAAAEMPAPEAVDHHTGGQGSLPGSDRPRPGATPGPGPVMPAVRLVSRPRRRPFRQYGKKSRLHLERLLVSLKIFASSAEIERRRFPSLSRFRDEATLDAVVWTPRAGNMRVTQAIRGKAVIPVAN